VNENHRVSFQINANVYAKEINHYKPDQPVTYHGQDLTSSVLEQRAFFVVAYGAVENKSFMENILSGVENGGFLLTVERHFDSKFRQVGLDVVARYTDGHNSYVLLKKVIYIYYLLIARCFNTHSVKILIHYLERRCARASGTVREIFVFVGRILKIKYSKRQ